MAVVHLVVQIGLSTAPAINDILQRICNAVCSGVCYHVSAILFLSYQPRPSQTHLGMYLNSFGLILYSYELPYQFIFMNILKFVMGLFFI